MEMQSHESMDDPASRAVREDEAVLYSWANLEGASERDFSAERREYRAQMRHRAAERLRMVELRAQTEAGAGAIQTKAFGAAVKLAVPPNLQHVASESEEQLEHRHRSSLREAAEHARRAAAERLEAARRAEAAALADSIARREEREIAEAQASASRQAALSVDAEARGRQKKFQPPDDLLPERTTNLHGMQPPEGGNFEQPWMPYREFLRLNGIGAGGTARGVEPELRPQQPEVRASDPEYRAPIPEVRTLHPEFPSLHTEVPPLQAKVVDHRIAEPSFERSEALAAEQLIGTGYSQLQAVARGHRDHPEDAAGQYTILPENAPTAPADSVSPEAPTQAGVDPNFGPNLAEQSPPQWYALRSIFAEASEVVDSNHAHRLDGVRANGRGVVRERNHNVPILAVCSLSGGVGKTSLVATLGRALSSHGEQVLLTETTSAGLLPFYYGASEARAGVLRTFSPPAGKSAAPVQLLSDDVDAEHAPETNAIGQRGDFFARLIANSQRANRILMDVSADRLWVIERLASMQATADSINGATNGTAADATILVPVKADMNSLIGLKAMERRFSRPEEASAQRPRPVYLLNQFDAALPLHLEIREVLKQRLGERLLPFVIRRADRVSEALAEGMTIIDYDPDSEIALEFLGIANWLRSVSAPTAVRLRNPRWSER